MGEFVFLKKEDAIHWKKIKLATDNLEWGGEPAGDIITKYLYPEIFTLYTNLTKMDIVKNILNDM
jgi:hypothetical protein